MQKEQIGDAVLYCGDCLEIMPALEKVDHVITDPPYADRTHKKAKTNLRIKPESVEGYSKIPKQLVDFGSVSNEWFLKFCENSLALASRWIIMTCDHHHAPLVFNWPEFIRLGAWIKIAPMPQITGDRPGQGHEAVLILHNEGKKRWNRGGGAAIWRHQKINKATHMPTEKPQALIDAFISDFTDSGEIILDPCMGSGTTGVSAVQQGRKFVGVEIRQEAFDIACERIEQAQKQHRLFI